MAKHTHAVAGGGSQSHDHDFPDTDSHGHGPKTEDNDSDKKLLPFRHEMAEMSSKSINDLPDSAFAYIEPGGEKDEEGKTTPRSKRHFPVHDKAHTRNALSRAPQSPFGDKAMPKIKSAAKKFGIKVSMSERRPNPNDGALIELSEEMEMGEGRVPLLRTGEWHFDNAYGDFAVGRDDLQTIKQVFDERVRRQDWPVFFKGQIASFGEANEDHDHHPSRAVGWIRGLEFRDDDHLDAVVDFTETGDRLVKEGAYKYSSAELLRNWKDPETGAVYPLVAYGVALTNTPRVKEMGVIAASEDGAAQLLAFSEGPVSAPFESARRVLMAEENDPDGDGDDDGPVPPCVFQPGYGHCPGFTRWPGDNDGDGVCLMATKGCNGYRAIPPDLQPLPVVASMYSESTHATGEAMTTDGKPAAGAPVETGEPAAATAEKPAEQSPDAAEDKNILASERAARSAAEEKVAKLSERVTTLEAHAKMDKAAGRLERAAEAGRITPAQRQVYEEHLVSLSEDSMEWLLSEIENREPVIKLGEKGVAGSNTTLREDERLDAAAKAYMSERKQAGEKVSIRDALLHVSSTGYGRS